MADRYYGLADRLDELGQSPADAYAAAAADGSTHAMPPLDLSGEPAAPDIPGDPAPVDPDAALHHAVPGLYKPGAKRPSKRQAPAAPAPIADTGTLADTQEQLPALAGVRPTTAPIEDPADAASLGEVYSAAKTLQRGDNSMGAEDALRKGYAPIVEALHLDPGENPTNFEQIGWANSLGTLTRYGARSRADQVKRLAELIREGRAVHGPDFMKGVPDDPAKLDDYALAGEKKARAEARAVLDRSPGGISGTLAQVAGSAVAGIADPAQLVTLPIGGGGKTVLQVAGREFLAQSALEALQLPGIAENRAKFGEQLTAGEAAIDVAGAGVGGSVLGAGFHGASHAIGAAWDRMMPRIFEAMPESVQRRWADRMKVGNVKLTDVLNDMDNREIASFARSTIGADKMTPDEKAAANVLEREQDVGESSPYQPGAAGDQAHQGGLGAALQDLENRISPVVAPDPAPGANTPSEAGAASLAAKARPSAALSTDRRPLTGDPATAIANFKAKVGGAENATGNVNAKNPRSSASGPAQFTDGTFRDYYKKVYGRDPGAHPAQALKNNPEVQSKLLDALAADNAAALERAGEAVSEGNLYLAHFLGARDAVRVLKADASTPIERVLSDQVLEANPHLRGKSTSQVAAWAYTKMDHYYPVASVGPRGEAGALDPASEDPQVAQLRAEALQLDNEVIGAPASSSSAVPPMYSRGLAVNDIAVDANRFQFKSGGDEFGVTDRLKGVKEWNPLYAGRVIVWEDREGRAFLADGHQRHGLARRIQEQTGEPIRMDAIVLREADGVTAEDARVYAALKNIAEGTGTAVDAAKVIRDAGGHVLEHLPPKSALVRDGAALAHLSDAAFGAVVNDVIPADFAAVIGHLLPDRPEAHEAMVELLAKLDPANRGQAESIVRQAIAAGLHKEEQIDLFGSKQSVTSLMLERAKVLEKGLAKLRKLGSVFKVAASEADTLEAAGSRIARDRSAKEAQANAAAVEIVSRLAFSRGPVADALNDAAAELAGGAKLGSVVDEFVGRVRELDLAAVSREAASNDANGVTVDEPGRGSDVAEEGPELFSEPGDPPQPSLIELEHATERFSDPDGKPIQQQAESLEHDLKADVAAASEPLPAARTAAFLDELGAKPGLHPDEGFDVTVGAATATLMPGKMVDGGAPDFVELKMITSSNRGSGAGSDLLRRIVDLADKHGVAIELYAKGFDGVPTSKLVSWYERFGFKNLDGRVPTAAEQLDPDHLGVDMAREPQAPAANGERARGEGVLHAAADLNQLLEGQRGASIEDLLDRAKANQAELAGAGAEIADVTGAEFVDPGAKNPARVLEKAADYADPGELKDLARAGFLVTDVAQGDKILAELAGRFKVYDKGWQPLNSGYIDRKIIIAFPNGGVAEIQIIPKAIADYKFGAGHALYEKARDPRTSIDEFETLVREMRVNYDRLLEGSDFAALGKDASSSAAESSVPSSSAARTVETDASRQAPASNTNPVSGSSTATGRSSSSNSLMTSTSPGALDMGPKADPGKIARDRQLIGLGAAAPLRAAGDVAQLGEIGLPLMDVADQHALTFRLDDGEEIAANDLLAELAADDKAIKAMRDCL